MEGLVFVLRVENFGFLSTFWDNLRLLLRRVGARRLEMMAEEEGALAEKAKSGDREAFEELVDLYHQRIFALSCSLIGDYHAAQDAAQETFLRAFKGIETLREPSKIGKWLAGIAYKVSKTHIRNEARKGAVFRPGFPDSLAFLVKEAPDGDLRKRVVDAANSLPADSRALLALKYLEGLSYADIAQIMGIEDKTVKSRLHTARRQLREKLGSYRPAE